MNPQLWLLVYIAMIFISFLLEVFVKHVHFLLTRTHYKEHHFIIGRYIISLIFPLVALVIIYFKIGSSILNTFLVSAILGTCLEWVVGWWFYKVMGTRLWTYHRYAITKYTSFLSIPLWGLAGVFTLLIAKLFVN